MRNDVFLVQRETGRSFMFPDTFFDHILLAHPLQETEMVGHELPCVAVAHDVYFKLSAALHFIFIF